MPRYSRLSKVLGSMVAARRSEMEEPLRVEAPCWARIAGRAFTQAGMFYKWSSDQFGCYDRFMKQRTVSVTEFKAKCLALLDEIGERGGTITITKRGRPLATVGPVRRKAWKSSEGSLVGKITVPDDLESIDTSDLWEVLREAEKTDT
jgi:prevent-host-death family protein